MNNLEHQTGSRAINLLVRHLTLTGVNRQNQNAIINAIDNVFDVDSVQYDENAATLHLAYDVSLCELDGLEEMLIQHDVGISHEWLTCLEKGHYPFIDENIREHT
ncbi:cation transporter [Paraglaciecola sp.]|uniref:cation transporter n=1 Tax=Paraglaciecola sp. TaxID=1920173 RepID=UPI0030F371D9